MVEQTKTAADTEEVEYEYVEVPEGEAAEYEYVEVPENGEIEYEYVEEELPAENPAVAEEVEYEYVEAEVPATGAAEEVEYEYVEEELPAETPAVAEEVEYEYVEAEVPATGAAEEVEYEYVEEELPAEVPTPTATEEAVEYEYVEEEIPATGAAEEVEYEYVEEELPAEVPAPTATEEAVEYEYVEEEIPATGAAEEVEYEYVEEELPAEVPAPTATEEAVEYEYVEEEIPAEAPAVATEEVEYEYVEEELPAEVPAPVATEEAVEEVPAPTATEEAVEYVEEEVSAEAPAAATEEVEYEYVEEELPTEVPAPVATEEAVEEVPVISSAQESIEPELPPETFTRPTLETEHHDETIEPELPPDDVLPSSSFEELEAIPESRVNEEYEETNETVSAEELETVVPPPVADVQTPSIPKVTEIQEEHEDTAAIDALAEETQEEESKPVDEAQIIAEETQEEQDPEDVSDMLPPTGAFSFDGSETRSFTGSPESNTVVLTNVMHAFDQISQWYLLISEFSVTALEEQNGAEIPLSEDIFCQGAFINADGTTTSFSNQLSLTVPADQTNLALCGMKVIPLAGQENSTIDLEGSAGMLIGPNGVQLMFSGLNKLTVPAIDQQETTTVSQNASVVSLAELPVKEENVFTFTAESGAVETQSPVILVKTGYSLYGWNVVFKNGQTMSLADVRTYQTKHGVLPDSEGKIIYKQSELIFSNAEKIRVYEKPSYCGYGKPSEK